MTVADEMRCFDRPTLEQIAEDYDRSLAYRIAAADELACRRVRSNKIEQPDLFPAADRMTTPDRVRVLQDAAALTNGDRDTTYGPPSVNQNAAGRLKALMRELTTRDVSPAELEALDMVMTKLSRIMTGPVVHRDNYVDGSAYFAIAYENAMNADK